MEYKVIIEKTVSIEDIKNDIEYLELEFDDLAHKWEYSSELSNTTIAQKELSIVKMVAKEYPSFQYEYEPQEFENNNAWYNNDIFTQEDFATNNVTSDNYGKADAVAFDIKQGLIAFLETLIRELEWLPSRFREEFLSIVYDGQQDAKSIRKNAEYFSESILDELTEEEKALMFIEL